MGFLQGKGTRVQFSDGAPAVLVWQLRLPPAPFLGLVHAGETLNPIESAHGCEQAIKFGQEVKGLWHNDGKPVLEVRLLLPEHGG